MGQHSGRGRGERHVGILAVVVLLVVSSSAGIVGGENVAGVVRTESAADATASVSVTAPASVTPGSTMTVTASFVAGEMRPTRETVSVTLPDGWEVMASSVNGNGTWNASAERLQWPSVDPNETRQATLTIRVPADENGQYVLSVAAESTRAVAVSDSTTVTVDTDGREVVETEVYPGASRFKDITITERGFLAAGKSDDLGPDNSTVYRFAEDRTVTRTDTFDRERFHGTAKRVIPHKDGYVLVTVGDIRTAENLRSVVGVESNGTVAWNTTVAGWGVGEVARTANGSLFVTGDGLYRLDAEGTVLWHRLRLTMADVFRTETGSVVTAGSGVFARLSPNGTVESRREIEEPGNPPTAAVTRAADGGYLYVSRQQHDGDYRVEVRKLSVDGRIEWERVVDGPENEYVVDAVQTRDGGFLVVVESQSVGDGFRSVLAVEFGDDGTREWETVLGADTSPRVNDIERTNNGSVLLTGHRDLRGSITVLGPDAVTNSVPQLRYETWPDSVDQSDAVTFDVFPTFDPDGNVTAVEWQFGHNATATGDRVSHTFTETGNVSVTVTVRDDDGAATTETRTVSVTRQCVTGAVAGADDRIGLRELQRAVSTWAEGDPVAGRAVSLRQVQRLVDVWTGGEAVSCG
jgi:hypothetical protein